MSTRERAMGFSVMPTSVQGGLFASYELKLERKSGAIFAGYGIQGIIILLLLTISFTAGPSILPKKYSSVSLVAPPEPAVMQHPRVHLAPPGPGVSLSAPAEVASAAPMRIQAPRIPHVDRPVAMPAPAAPRPVMSSTNVPMAIPTPTVAAKPVHVGAFGVPAQSVSTPSHEPVLAAVGSFSSPAEATGRSTGHAVAMGAFGSPESVPGEHGTANHRIAAGAFGSPEGGNAAAPSKALHSVDFSEPALAKARPTEAVKAAALVSVAILSKPEPVYTEEARRLHIEGSVALRVVFTASGEMKIIGVVKGLGHGLDEAAITAARQIRFTPARREGQSMDYPATIHIVFALS